MTQPNFKTYEEFCEYYKDYYVCSRELFEMGARNVGAPRMDKFKKSTYDKTKCQIKDALLDNKYYVGNSEAVKILREIIDEWED